MPRDTVSPVTPGDLDPRVVRGFDGVMNVQRPVVLAHLRSVRRRHPDATPAEIIEILEKRYLTAVTAGGAAVGASAAVPGIGTITSLGLSAVETAGFLEASALFAQSVTEVHGVAVDDPERSRTLVMMMMLGSGGSDLVKQFAGQVNGGQGRSAFWGDMVTSRLPKAALGQITSRIRKTFVKRFVARQGASVFGRLIPFGIGAVVGGTGNRLLGRKVIDSARDAFGPAPALFPVGLQDISAPSREERQAVRAAEAEQKRLRKQAEHDLAEAEKDAKRRRTELEG